MTTLIWLREDLRLADQPMLRTALDRGGAVIPVYLQESSRSWAPGAAHRVWRHHALAALAADLAQRGSQLVLRTGAPAAELAALAAETGATALYFNERSDPAGRAADDGVRQRLGSTLDVRLFDAGYLLHPRQVATASGGPYKVFTPFWREMQRLLLTAPPRLIPAPDRLPAPGVWPASVSLDALGLLPTLRWDLPMMAHWETGERAAQGRLEQFLDGAVRDYASRRDFPGVDGVSRLSPCFAHGQLSPRRVWAVAWEKALARGALGPDERTLAWLRQLVWREFAHHLLWHFPQTSDRPLRPEFESFPWCEKPAEFARWCRGQTGFPIVDAGMRELWQTGWMHNRVRMVVASFLTKDLGVHWLRGAEWFWDTLVDADLANNTLGWQWTAGCGADAAPYFRVFNPTLQSAKFDPDGHYLRRWLPELAALPTPYLHEPAAAPPLELAAAGLKLGEDYPLPMLDHAAARHAALARLKQAAG